MRSTQTLLTLAALVIATSAVADTYFTDATLSHPKDDGVINVDVRVLRLVENDGGFKEELIAWPRVQTSPGVKATAHTGLQPDHPDYHRKENVSVDVSWPYPNESGTAICAITVKLGDDIVSKSQFGLKIEGPGRTPLILLMEDINPQSVKVGEEDLKTFVLLEFAHKTKAEAKKLAVENYGNSVQIRGSRNRLIDAGRSFGAYNELGMALDCETEQKARAVASRLRGEETE